MPDHDAVWSALGHPARRRLVEALREHPAPTGAMHAALADAGLSPSRFATQRHLQVLREADLVLVTDRGRERVNALNASALYQATVGWLDPASARTAHALDSLKRLAEAPTAKEQPMHATEFHVRQAIEIAADPASVWAALTEAPQRWWGAPYLLLDDADVRSTFEFPLEAGRPVVERRGEASALWGLVTECTPGRAYAWNGQMGMGPAASGEVRYELEPTASGTRVTVVHDWVHLWGDAEGMGASYDYGWADLNARLARLVEAGEEWGAAGENRAPDFGFTASL